MPHRIHLRGPWNFAWQSDSSGAADQIPSCGTVSMPQDWRAIFGNVIGTAEFKRKFHKPTNLDPDERVFILFTEVRGRGKVLLNDVPLGDFVSDGLHLEFDLTKLMKSFNELTVTISFDAREPGSRPGGLFGVAALEIRKDIEVT